MKFIPPKFTKLEDMAEIDARRLTEDEARNILEGIRWPNGIFCIYCNSTRLTRLDSSTPSVRDGIILCNDCRKQFTVTVGTVMQGSHITLRQWVQAFYAMCSSKKGVSALQLQRNLCLGSYRTAWYMAHRIRLAMKSDPIVGSLKGIVEVDETYVGGKPRKGEKDENGNLVEHKRGRGTKKTPVVALIERDGKSIVKVMEQVNADNLRAAIRENVAKTSTVMTDDSQSYNGVEKEIQGKHESVKHSAGEYVRGSAHINTDESFFALLKRGVHGTFHHISKTHLSRYCDEFSFRWNNRKIEDGERARIAIRGAIGKRLVYRKGVKKT